MDKFAPNLIQNAENLLKERLMDAEDYMEKMKEHGLIESIPSDTKQISKQSFLESNEKISHLKQHKFSIWLNKEPNFAEAKKRLNNKKMISEIVNKNNILLDLLNVHSIEQCDKKSSNTV